VDGAVTSCVVVIRVWFEHDKFRARAIMGGGDDGASPGETLAVTASIDELCAALRTFLTTRQQPLRSAEDGRSQTTVRRAAGSPP